MKIATYQHSRTADFGSLAGILAGMNLLIAACFLPDMGLLAVPAFAILLPSLLLGMR